MKLWQSQKSVSYLPIPTLKALHPLELNHFLQHCSNSRTLVQGKKTHQKIIIHGLEQDPFMATKLVQMYADCNDITSAHLLFDKLPNLNVYAWTAILAFFSRNGMPDECLSAYNEMKLNRVLPDKYVFPNVIRACAKSFCLKEGIQIHKEVISFGVEINLHICNSLIDMYPKCGDIQSARRVFDTMMGRDLLSWNSLISGYVSNGFHALAIELFRYMKLEPDVVTWNTIMDAYCRMGQCDKALKVFEKIEEPNIISWTTLISGYSRIANHVETLKIFRDMMCRGKVYADFDCLSSTLVSCRYLGALKFGQQIHAYGMKFENVIGFYKTAGPALLIMYARGRRLQEVRNVFSFMDKSDVVTWNAKIQAFSDLGMGHSALACFREMQIVDIQNDQITLSTVLPVCDLKSGKQIHAYISKSKFSSVVSVLNALIHMYSESGCIKGAYSVFSNMASRDVISWNSMIRGFGMHGFGQAALRLLQEMNNSGIVPNSFTFTSVLSACSHSGLVDEGLEVFHRMTRDFGSKPEMEHFACVIDLLARAGRLDEAVDFISRMPVEPDKCIWGAVLAASLAQQNISTGILAAEHLVHLEPANAGNYVTLSNMYVRAGKQEDASRVRKQMEIRRLVKPSGYSLIENEN